jgi:hypothetical protein
MTDMVRVAMIRAESKQRANTYCTSSRRDAIRRKWNSHLHLRRLGLWHMAAKGRQLAALLA